MEYSIITLDNPARNWYKENIRKNIGDIPFVEMSSIDGRAKYAHGLKIELGLKDTEWRYSQGELGVWLSHFIRWRYVSKSNQPLLVFEDDAIIRANFLERLNSLMSEIPDDYDFVSLWVPENQRQDYMYNVRYDITGTPVVHAPNTTGKSIYDIGLERASKVYQGYGLVATIYSPQGGKKLVKYADMYGLSTPADCFIFQHAHAERLNGYAPKPYHVFVEYDWPETTR